MMRKPHFFGRINFFHKEAMSHSKPVITRIVGEDTELINSCEKQGHHTGIVGNSPVCFTCTQRYNERETEREIQKKKN